MTKTPIARAGATVGLRIDPLDVLFFRDGRPFTPASRGASGLPTPQTLAGAVRTHLLQHAGCDFDALWEAAAEAGAEDVEQGDPHHFVACEFHDLHAVTTALEVSGFDVAQARPVRIAVNTVSVEGKTAESTLKLLEALEDHDDVQNVYINADISDEEMARLGG